MMVGGCARRLVMDMQLVKRSSTSTFGGLSGPTSNSQDTNLIKFSKCAGLVMTVLVIPCSWSL
jgi:hypothetical protein